MCGHFVRSILCYFVTLVDFGLYSSIVGICCFFCAGWSCSVAATRGQPRRATNKAAKMIEKNVMVRREARVIFWFLHIRIIFPQEGERAESSVRIPRYPAARAVAFPFARRTELGRGLSRPGGCLAHRAASTCSPDCALLARPQARRTHHAGN